MPNPFQFESPRRSLQRFLKLGSLNIESLWFPLVREILKAKFNKSQPLKLASDRTQWRSQNVFMRPCGLGETKYPVILATLR